ncbi:PilW family protein [Marinobacter sp.]|uniref:PilW family protein n=1 Tax=Marinobacter sp. TaxID=50741 RepID=UPI0035684A81
MASLSLTSLRSHLAQKGLSLVELMITLALSSALILGIFTVYLDSSKTGRLSNSLARIQESSRIAVDILARDLRMVGFQGCADPYAVSMNIIADNPPTGDFLQSTLRVWEVDGANWADGTEFEGTSIASDAVVGSDVIAVQRGETVPIEITGNMETSNANIQVTGQTELFNQNDIVLISDCENADLFRISSQPESDTWAHAEGVNSDNRLSQAYNEKANIFRFSSNVYFVRDTGRVDNFGNPIRALYRARNNLLNSGTPNFQIDELVEGVENMQVLLGEKLPGGNLRYRTADQAGLDFTAVAAVQLGLLLSDAEEVRDDSDTGSYSLPGETIGPASGGGVTHPEDRRLRRTFETTVTLRNRD